jgi:hypothetical protein
MLPPNASDRFQRLMILKGFLLDKLSASCYQAKNQRLTRAEGLSDQQLFLFFQNQLFIACSAISAD